MNVLEDSEFQLEFMKEPHFSAVLLSEKVAWRLIPMSFELL